LPFPQRQLAEEADADASKKDEENKQAEEVCSIVTGNGWTMFVRAVLTVLPRLVQESAVPQFVLPRDEVMARLRERGEPITFFAETDLQRAERLRKLELAQPMEYIATDGGDFVKIIRDEEEQEQTLEEALQKKEDDDPDFKLENREPANTEEQILFLFRVRLSQLSPSS
jgi:hypothetical protein